MKKFLLIVISILPFIYFSLPSEAKLTPANIYEANNGSVFLIKVANQSYGTGYGTGFAITKDGMFATASHVLQGASPDKITLLNKQTNETKQVEKIVFDDTEKDIAVFQTTDRNSKPVKLASAEDFSTGQEVTIISYPLGVGAGGLESTLSSGLISAVRENMIIKKQQKVEEEKAFEQPIYEDLPDKEITEVRKINSVVKWFSLLEKSCKNKKTITPDESILDEKLVILFNCDNDQIWAFSDSPSSSLTVWNNQLKKYVIESGSNWASMKIYKNYNSQASIRPWLAWLLKPAKLQEQIINKGKFIQHTAAISHGSSGSPLFNEDGYVIGVNLSSSTRVDPNDLSIAQGLNYARPVSFLPKEFISQNYADSLILVSSDGSPANDSTLSTNSAISSKSSHSGYYFIRGFMLLATILGIGSSLKKKKKPI
ncbi:MAG: trypsin-like peptidase domain-containing protein [Candidatus Caenarcaniphilales bacterium]|nr:trypsin-like peptidase domain-containing protein [Candidatus Caenarcaniphilales bacterium]